MDEVIVFGFVLLTTFGVSILLSNILNNFTFRQYIKLKHEKLREINRKIAKINRTRISY